MFIIDFFFFLDKKNLMTMYKIFTEAVTFKFVTGQSIHVYTGKILINFSDYL